MEAKLIKVLEHYHLYDGDKAIATTIVGNPMLLPNLSIKNCQSIERGYDLDELAKNIKTEDDFEHKQSFIAGFQKALELNNTKLYTLEDMMNCWNKALTFQTHKETLGEHIQSLQQTEWDVEIATECLQCQDWGYVSECRNSCNQKFIQPKLDADDCLILKLKSE